jgi:hypothetical protein
MIEMNVRDASISTLKSDVISLSTELEDYRSASRVLEHTLSDRLPKLEARLAEAKRLLYNRDREIAELMQGAKKHKLALEEASIINAQQNAQIARLTRGSRSQSAPADSRTDSETNMRGEIDALRIKTREQGILIDSLQERLGHLPGAAVLWPPSQGTRDPGPQGALRDQSGEIARLKAALAVFEQHDGKTAGGLRDSKLAFRAALDQQAATITGLRTELAAAHERLAHQAAKEATAARKQTEVDGGLRNAPRPMRRLRLLDRILRAKSDDPAGG